MQIEDQEPDVDQWAEEKPPRRVRVERKTPRRLGIWLAIPLALVCVLLFVFAHQWKESLVVKSVKVDGMSRLSARDIVDLASIAAGSRLYDLDLYGIAHNILANPMIRSVAIERELPSSIAVSVIEREPIALITGTSFCAVDREGILLPRQVSGQEFDVPIISGVAPHRDVELGCETHDREILEALDILESAARYSMSHVISEVIIEPGKDVLLTTTEGTVRITLGRGNYDVKFSMLDTFWKDFVKANNIDELRSIDLRFEDQVVVRWNTPGGVKPTKFVTKAGIGKGA